MDYRYFLDISYFREICNRFLIAWRALRPAPDHASHGGYRRDQLREGGNQQGDVLIGHGFLRFGPARDARDEEEPDGQQASGAQAIAARERAKLHKPPARKRAPCPDADPSTLRIPAAHPVRGQRNPDLHSPRIAFVSAAP